MNDIVVDQSAIDRINTLREKQNRPLLKLRVIVDGGGCSGFQYKRELTEEVMDNERIYEDVLITDDVSLPFLLGATIKFEESLIGAEFVIDNPNAKMGCGCGTSFSV